MWSHGEIEPGLLVRFRQFQDGRRRTITMGDDMNAAQMKRGERAVVQALHHASVHKERLLSFGIGKGSLLILHATTCFHDPLLFESDGALLSLRRRDAEKIEVTRI